MVAWVPAVVGGALVAVGVAVGVVFVRRMNATHNSTSAALLALSDRREDLLGVLRAALEVDPKQPAIINDLQEHRIVLANGAFHAALKTAPGSLNGRPYLPLIHPDDLARTDAAADDVPLMDAAARFRNRYQTADGRWVVLEWRGGHYADAGGYGLSLADVVGYEAGGR